MVINIFECAKLIKKHDEFTVLSHEHPDGDTLGCAYALCAALKKLGKKREFKCCDEVSKDFYYMSDGFENDTVNNPYIVSVDVADVQLLGSLADEYGSKVDLCIDHHGSNSYYAANTLVEERAAACEIIYELIKVLGVEPDGYIRDAVYTGISTDTGCFRYPNTTSNTFRVASELYEKGCSSKLINKLMFETKTRSFLKLQELALKTLEYHFDERCAIITITNEMYEQSGSNEHECYPITALPRQIEGVLVGLVIKQKANGTYGASVRTEGDIDASAICAQLGGGGHRGAAGCRFDSYNDGKARLLEVIKNALDG